CWPWGASSEPACSSAPGPACGSPARPSSCRTRSPPPWPCWSCGCSASWPRPCPPAARSPSTPTRALGRWAGFTAGWLYWAVTVIAIAIELIAAATILHQWMPAVPQWTIALVALAVFTQSNMFSVSSFGEAEFWFAGIKVAAIIAFLALGVAALCGAVPGVDPPGMDNLTGRGGFLPQGWDSVVAGLLTVVFAFGGMEVVTMAAAESGDPARSVTKAVSSAIWRISLFYLGSMAVIVTLLPWDAATPGRSPYVAVLDRLGIPGAGRLIEVVVLIALLSAMNANLYGASRMAHSLAARGEAPKALLRTSARGAPRLAVAASAAFGFVAIALDHRWPERILPFLAKGHGRFHAVHVADRRGRPPRAAPPAGAGVPAPAGGADARLPVPVVAGGGRHRGRAGADGLRPGGARPARLVDPAGPGAAGGGGRTRAAHATGPGPRAL
ncbi:LOW QUALITY PROTEIN: GABA permease, partial [Streptomyces sp. C]